MEEAREMNAGGMLYDLAATMGNLSELEREIHYRRCGEDMGGGALIALEQNERRHPLVERKLEFAVREAYRHLTCMWNGRKMTDKEIEVDLKGPLEKSLRHQLPPDYKLLKDCSRISMRSKYMRFKLWQGKCRSKIKPPESFAEYVARALLIDPRFSLKDVREWYSGDCFYPDFNVRVRYCQERRPGWEDIAQTIGEALRVAAYWRLESFAGWLPANIETALKGASSSVFFLQLSIDGYRFTRRWLRILVERQAWRLLEVLIREGDELFKVVAPRSLLLNICADGRYEEKGAVSLIRALERRFPGIVARTVDVFGDTPLWYTYYRYQYGGHKVTCLWREHCGQIQKTLMKLGCDPDRKNTMGLSWRDLKCWMKH